MESLTFKLNFIQYFSTIFGPEAIAFLQLGRCFPSFFSEEAVSWQADDFDGLVNLDVQNLLFVADSKSFVEERTVSLC